MSSVQCLSNAADGVRLAARIVDTPCNEMNTDHFLDVSRPAAVSPVDVVHTDASFLFQEIKAVGTELGIAPLIIRGEELKQRGFGGVV